MRRLGLGLWRAPARRRPVQQIADLCIATGVDETLIEAWIEIGRQRASAAATTHKACASGTVNGDIVRAWKPHSLGAPAGPR